MSGPGDNLPASQRHGPAIVPFRAPDGAEERLKRLPPYSAEAEQALLGALLIDNRALEDIAELALKPEHFGNALHGRIFAAITGEADKGRLANPLTLRALFDQDAALKDQAGGGGRYLAQLAEAGAALVHAADYARLVRDFYLRRELIGLGEAVTEAAFGAALDDPPQGQIERAEAQLYRLAESGDGTPGFQPIGAAMGAAIAAAEAAYKRGARITGVATGFADLDRLLGGLHAGDLVVLAGRPAMGKTALAVNIASNAAASGEAAAIFSLEMACDQLAARELGGATGIASDWIRRGDLRPGDFDALLAAQHRLAGLPLYIDDSPALTIAALRARARRLKRRSRQGLGLVVVDYLQLLLGDHAGRGERNRVQEVSDITRGLKALAKELALPVLALSQLSRAVEARDDKRPLLSDLRDSGSIEQDADVVVFVFREEYYLREPDPADAAKWTAWRDKLAAVINKAELIVAKHRHGPTGAVQLHFDHRTTRFSNWAAAS